ncbi:hypothetical protein GPECTOR_36g6 [Gonium pectorale]|uniref:starch synthase n=1 Tax=Gonium pectorale TaxID=33097 RepID=A0A150GCP1_GONPE|nr:hypothetical protein GPECTOR_36g6 [Gonium pectorale]|eukprot:KXZ47335.1 hypothetical protein GPECTOR_36g6 [Gonium pectorale]
MGGEFDALREQLARAYPDRAALVFTYDEPLSHLIYAGSDMFLVPSMFEPCGLTQDWSWNSPALDYLELYYKALKS